MRGWPPITEPLLLERLAMSYEEYLEHLATITKTIPSRAYDVALYEHGLGYPWERPPSSYLMRGDLVEPVADMDDRRREAIFARFAVAEGHGARFPLLAYGANGAPARLAMKLAHFPPEDREVLVLAGALHDFDVGASAHPSFYGALPGTIFPSPGTAVRCAVLWVSAVQFVQLTWSELSYCLGRLDGVRFDADDAGAALGSVFAFVSRFGAFSPAGEPVALAAVPAQRRTARALTQGELLGAAARLALGAGASSEDLARELVEDYDAFAWTRGHAVRSATTRFASERWVTFPGGTDP
ncbi:MAG TPA: hypothetical protein VGO81_13180 [Solirubrobacteraceae bacterium]|nr:hypothetical protein [Solirubrobacteraceae bacterium]